MVSNIIRQNSENKLLYTPFMAVHITTIVASPARRQSPTFVSTKMVDERALNESETAYTGELGDRYTVYRHMPVPYDFTFQLDIWTSNTDQKMQLLEQIMMLFNPSIDLQTSDNALDWTAITFAQLEDTITWSSRSVPLGTDDAIDVASMQFLVPFWINPPAAVIHRKAIETIVTNIRAVQDLPADDSDFEWENGDMLAQDIITPGNHVIRVDGNTITLLGAGGSETDPNDEVYPWKPLLDRYSNYSEIHANKLIIKRRFGDPDGVIGTFEIDSVEPNKLIWTIDPDTLPGETLDSIDAIIDPTVKFPGTGLPSVAVGQRYLIAEDIFRGGDDVSELGLWGVNAKTNDIIEYDGSQWNIVFDRDGPDADNIQIVLNGFSGKLFRWLPEDREWQFAVDGEYMPGTWKILFAGGEICT
jgi:hypothetical protein